MKKKTLTEWLSIQEQLCEKAPKGPWIHTGKNHDGWEEVIQNRNPCDDLYISIYGGSSPESTGDFIAASRLALPKALKIIKRLKSGIRNHGLVVAVIKDVEDIINEADHA